MRLGLRFWSAILVFQVVYGVAVFLITRQVYLDNPVATEQELTTSQSAPTELPHPIPLGMPNKNPVSLSGSERITFDDAQRLVESRAGDKNTVIGATPEEISNAADRHFKEGLFQQAAAEYARVLELAPDNVDLYNNLGLTLHYVGRSQEAVEILQKGIAVDATHQRIWLTLGFVQSGLGDVSAARRSLSTAAELDSKSKVGQEAKRLLEKLP